MGLFDTLTGTYTSIGATGIITPSLGVSIDELKSRRARITISTTTTEFSIVSNTDSFVEFVNSLVGAGTYSIQYVTRALLQEFESDMSSTTKVSDALISSKIEIAKRHFKEKLKAQFRYLYEKYPNDSEPLERIINLSEVQMSFCYYVLHLIYSDLLISEGDLNEYKSRLYLSKYKEIVDTAIGLLSYRKDTSTTLENSDKASPENIGVMLSR